MAEESQLVHASVTLSTSKPRDNSEQPAVDGSDVLGADPNEPGGITDNLRHLLPLVCVSDGQQSVTKRVRHLNDLAKVIKCAGHVIEPNYPVERVIECVRLALASGVKEVRAGALRVLRYLLTSKEAFAVMLKHRVDLFVARSLDVPADREIERLQAMRFVRQAISVSPEAFPRSLASPLVSILLFDIEPQDNLTWSCMATLCELALHNAELASQSGAIRALIRGLLKCSTSRISESVTLTLSHLLNKPSTRTFIRSQLDIETLFAPITDLHYRHLIEEMDKSSLNQDNSSRIEASKMAIVALLKSWPGIFSLCSPSNSGLDPLLSMLPLTTPDVQKEILDVLYSVFQLKVPVWTESFTDAVTSIDPAQPKNEWSLTEGFVAAEGKDLLPPKTVDRTDLVNCYQALLLATLLETGLFDCLVEVCLKAERHIAVMATILMAQLLHKTNTILPPGYSSDAHTLPDLIASAIDFVEAQDQRHRASEVISCLDRVHQLKKQRVKPSSLYLKLILEQSAYFMGKKKGGDTEQQHTPSELDEASLSSLVKDTGILATKQYQLWNWKLLFSVLQHPSLKPNLLQEDGVFARFIKRLCNFYMPSKHLYSVIVYNEANTKRYSAVGQQLVKYLCRVEDSSSGYLFDLVSDIVAELTQVTASKLTADVFSSTHVSHKLSRDYFLFLGTISFHKPYLLLQCKAYGPLLDICNYQNRTDLMRLVISTLDFAHDIYSRVILNKLLTSTDKDMRLYATKHMRVLLRAKMPFFNSWGLELIIPQLYDVDRQVAMEAVDILDEACEEENFLEALVLQQPQLLHLGEKGAALLTRFFSVKRGFNLMSRMGYLELQLSNWSKEYNLLYVYIVEERLAETLTSFKQTEDGEFVRRTNTALIFPKAFVPVHLYGQLVQHEEGCAFLEKENHVSRFSETIRAEPSEKCTPDEILSKKAAIWALGHIGSSPGGLQLLLEEEVIGDMVDLAETCPILSIRGTCFYALCLISKTTQGANVLLEANWTTVRHSVEEKWPLAIDPNFDLSEETAFTPAEEQMPTPLFNFLPAPFVQSPFDLPTPNRTLSYKSFASDKSTTLPGRVAALGLESVEGTVKFDPGSPSPTKTQQFQLQHRQLHKTESTKSLNPSHSDSFRKRTGNLNTHRYAKRHLVSLKDRSFSFVRSEKRSHSRRSQKSPVRETSIKSPPRPKSLSAADLLESPDEKRRNFSSTTLRSLSRTTSGNRLPSTVTSTHYLGVCLPMDISRMFDYEEPEFKGCITSVISAPDFTNPDTIPPHDPLHCLECSIPLIKSYHGIGMYISSDSLSSHFLFAPSSSSGGTSPHSPRSRSQTLDNPLSDSKKTKSSHIRSASAGLPSSDLANVHTVNGSHTDGSPSSGSKSDQSESKETEIVSPEVEDSGERQSRSLVRSNNKGSVPHDRLETEGRASRSPSPLVRMKRIHNSEEALEMKGKVALVQNGDGAHSEGSSKQEIGVVKTGTVPSSQSSDLKDPEVLIQVIKPSTSHASTKLSSQVTSSPSTTVTETTETSSNSSSQSGVVDEASPEGRSRLQHAVLEVVYGLSSDVSLKKNTLGLNMICHRFPSVIQDICLYSQVMDILSSYHYNLHTRRLIESKFEKMTFEPLFAAKPQLEEDFSEDDLISSNSSSRRTSFSSLDATSSQTSLTSSLTERDPDRPLVPFSQSRAFRRRSSTSDTSRFREKLQSLSQSAEMHESMMVESPVENETSKTNDKEVFRSSNTNSNNNSPGVDETDYAIDASSNRAEKNENTVVVTKTHQLGSMSDSSIPVLRSVEDSDNSRSYDSDSGVLSVLNTGFDL